MTTVLITPDDLAPFATIAPDKAQAMIEDATATAIRVAPCLNTSTDDDVQAAARAVLRAAILRWDEAGTGEVAQRTMGPYAVAYTQTQRRSLFWPSEIEQLQALCRTTGAVAFAVDMAPMTLAGTPGVHPFVIA